MINSRCAVITVTHNSQSVIPKAMECLMRQSLLPNQIILVDSGSSDTSYLKPFQHNPLFTLLLEKGDVGFCRGNNIGLKKLNSGIDYVLFLNPDAFLEKNFLEQAVALMDKEEYRSVGCMTSPLFAYDMQNDRPTGKYDSTGIFRTWYGKWHDRAQGCSCAENLYMKREEVKAICGALMFCRWKALKKILINNEQAFDESFYMYKEDIDLSLRFKRAGWKLLFEPTLTAYHCRGWLRDRSQIDRKWRLLSSRNDLKLDMRYLSPYLLFSTSKYLAVKLFDV